MQKFFRFFWNHSIPRKDVFLSILKPPLSWQGLCLYILLIAIGITAYGALITLNNKVLVAIPVRGGTLTEGVIGAPRLINPVLATTETDIGLTKLIFSGLMKETRAGTIEPDLAKEVVTSPDGRTYTFTLREKLEWSDGAPLTANDIVFTLTKRARFEANSYWQDVSVSSPEPQTVVITLPAPRADLLEHATLGIIPMHLWGEVADEAFESSPYNLRPVGSGPFAFVRLYEKDGIAEELVLKRNTRYADKHSYINRYHVLFFANQDTLGRALSSGDIMLTGVADPVTAAAFSDSYTSTAIASTTTVGLFETKNATLFSPEALRILNQTIDKAHILATIEYGYGTLLVEDRISLEEALSSLHSLGYKTRADGTLEKNGIPIAFSVAVENDPRTLAAAQAFVAECAKLGISVSLKAFDPGRFQDIIQQSEYQFFFGGVALDDMPNAYRMSIPLYQRSYPLIHDRTLRISIDAPLMYPVDRYRESNHWYLRTNKVWSIFVK